MNSHQKEAIATANAHLSNAVLPTYDELLAALIHAESALSARLPFSSALVYVLPVLDKAGVRKHKAVPFPALGKALSK